MDIFFFKYFNTELCIFWTLYLIKARPNKKNVFRVTILNLNFIVKPTCFFYVFFPPGVIWLLYLC